MAPLSGSAVAREMPAAASAFELTHELWPSKHTSVAGRSASAASSWARVGSPPGKAE